MNDWEKWKGLPGSTQETQEPLLGVLVQLQII